MGSGDLNVMLRPLLFMAFGQCANTQELRYRTIWSKEGFK